MRTVVILLACAFTQAAMAADWERAIFTGESEAAGVAHLKCYYRSISGYEFSIIVKGMCPGMVHVNPETGDVRQ